MDGRNKSGHDGVVVAVEVHGEPGAARPHRHASRRIAVRAETPHGWPEQVRP